MKNFLKHHCKKGISLLLCISMILPNTSFIFAQEGTIISDVNAILDDYVEQENYEAEYQIPSADECIDIAIEAFEDEERNVSTDLSKITFVDADPSDVFNEMTPEAQEIFIEFMRTQDEDLLNYHKENVDPDCTLEFEEDRSTSSTAAALNTLSYELGLLGLTSAVQYALIGAGSSIVAAIGSGIATLGVGTIVGILAAAACSTVIIMNWGTISSKWTSITKAFEKAFKSYATSSTVSSAFSQSSTTYNTNYGELTVVESRVKGSARAQSIGKHISLSFVDNIVRNRVTSEIYFSGSTKTALLKFSIAAGTKTNLNKSFGADSTYTQSFSHTNYDVSGATLFVIYDFKTNKIFHAHFRLPSVASYVLSDTDRIRTFHGMAYRVKPTPIYFDNRFAVPNPVSLILSGDQFR